MKLIEPDERNELKLCDTNVMIMNKPRMKKHPDILVNGETVLKIV